MDADQRDPPGGITPTSSWTDQPASLERLPPEILLPIVTSLPGLDTLWNLLRASPQAWRLFSSHALAITEGILSGPNSILISKIQQLVRGVILARSEALPFQGLEDLRFRFMRRYDYWCRFKEETSISLGPGTLSASSASTAVLRSVVATAYQLSALSQACLASCLARLRDPSFRPLHASDPTPHYSHDYDPVGDWIPGWDREFVGTPVEVVDVGPPGWVEEMRVLRAMWIIQLTGEVQFLVADKADKIGWRSQDVEKLSRMDAADLVVTDKLPRSSYPEDIKSAIWYVETLGGVTKDTYCRLPRPPAGPRWITAPPIEEEYNLVPMGFRQNGKFHWLRGRSVPEDATPVNKRQYTDPTHWGQTEKALNWEPPCMRVFRSLTLSDDVGSGSPIPGVRFDSFRPLGLAFWDRRRLHLLGLVDGLHATHFSHGFYLFAWESILPAEEVARIKAAHRFEFAVEVISHYLVDLRPKYPKIAHSKLQY